MENTQNVAHQCHQTQNKCLQETFGGKTLPLASDTSKLKIQGQTLLSQRQFTCEMEKLRFVDFNVQGLGLNELPTLENFKEIQDGKRKQISQRITEYSKKSRENIRQGINFCLETLKKNNYKAQLENDMKKDGQNVFKLKQSAYENLGCN